MGILAFNTQTPGLTGDQINPRRCTMTTTQSLADITAPGYLNNQNASGNPILPTDIFEVIYDFNISTKQGTYGEFQVIWDAATGFSLQKFNNPSVNLPVAEGNIPVFTAEEDGSLEDSEIAATDILTLNTDITDYQEFVSLKYVLAQSAGTWTMTRIATGNYALIKTAANDTSITGIDITPFIRTAEDRGFKLNSIDVIYAITTAPLDAHSAVLKTARYQNNAQVNIGAVNITGTLATATNANPYLTNITLDSPNFLNNDDTKYVFELTVDAALTSNYSFYGLNLHYTKSVA